MKLTRTAGHKMARGIGWTAGLVVAGVLGLAPGAAAQAPGSAAHVDNILAAHEATPDGAGLLDVAVADATIASDHAELAGAGDPTDIDPMIRHARHVLHALDPEEFAQGPGSGFGLRPAVAGIRAELALAADAPDASEQVRAAAGEVGPMLDAIGSSIEAAVAEARGVVGGSDYVRAQGYVERLEEVCADVLARLEDVRARLAPLAS